MKEKWQRFWVLVTIAVSAALVWAFIIYVVLHIVNSTSRHVDDEAKKVTKWVQI